MLYYVPYLLFSHLKGVIMVQNKRKILIVEDDLISAEYLKQVLLSEDYDVIGIVDNGIEAIKQAREFKPDIVFMDIMLEGQMSGCEAAVQIYRDDADIKLIFLTAYFEQEMIDYAIDAEAVAYLLKPYRENEILATIQLVFANQKTVAVADIENIILKNGYSFNTKQCRLFKENKEVHLSKKLLKLIEILVKNKNVSVSNEQICTYIWGENKNDRTLRSLIHRIRTAISYDIIQNINGLGYKIA